jgi:hypothetical protein
MARIGQKNAADDSWKDFHDPETRAEAAAKQPVPFSMAGESGQPPDDPWEVFELDDDVAESEPEPGDFWGELDNDCNGIG